MDYPVYQTKTLIVGSGCAGLNAADTLHNLGETDMLLVTEGICMGTSRNTGSDKQTYYKLSLASGEADSVSEMAETLFFGGGVNGDTALIEAACSVRSFMKLVQLGVPFPTNRFGEFVGYQTDHDTRKRATSAGPLTSRYMTEALERSVRNKQIPIMDEILIFKIFTYENRVIGAAGFDKQKKQMILFRCENIILATGGPAMIYENTVYPESQTGMTGMALEAGAEGANLSEWQYGIASVDFRWNLSGTYQQVIPRYVSVDENGTEREFLSDYFETETDAVNFVFQKGYQWPFDSQKVHGSSVIDLIVYHETVVCGRKVYLDYTKEPQALESGLSALGEEAYTYLKNSDALLKTPIARLEKMNPEAIRLYQSHGIDLTKEKLRIAVCPQHMNGGLSVDENWMTKVTGLYAAGEAAGTFGMYRPGGTALCSTQTGSLRAAEHIAFSEGKPPVSDSIFERCKKTALSGMFGESDLIPGGIIKEFAGKMSRCGAHFRNISEMKKLQEEAKAFLSAFPPISVHHAVAGLKLRDLLITQTAVLDAMIFAAENIGSRGGALVADGAPKMTSAEEIFTLSKETDSEKDKIIYTTYQAEQTGSIFRSVRPIPREDNWFETVWNAYNEKRNQKKNGR